MPEIVYPQAFDPRSLCDTSELLRHIPRVRSLEIHLEAWVWLRGIFVFVVTVGFSGEAERSFRKEAERHSGMIPNTTEA